MKIGIVCPYHIFKPGGVLEHVQQQAEILRSRGHEVNVITPRPLGHSGKSAPEGVIFMGGSARIKTPSATSSDVSIMIDNDALDEELSKGYDVIHVHEPAVPFIGRQILPKVDCLRVGTFHAALAGNVIGKTLISSYRIYFKTILPYLDAITAVSPAAVGYIGNSIHQDEIQFIPNGINLKLYKNKSVKRDSDMILFIGRLEKRKGTIYLIKAFAKLKESRPKSKLVICGDGPMRSTLEKYVKDHKIKGVKFRGFISDKVKLDLLSKCGLFTSPAIYGESFGIVLAEAMAMQAPIVCHVNEGYKWVMRETGRISLVDCMDADAYAERLSLLLDDEEIRDVWQKWASEYVKQFDYERVVDQYEKLYRSNLN